MAKAIRLPPTHWQLEQSSSQGLSLEVSGDELPTHLAHTAYSHCPRCGGLQPCHFAFCQLLPTQRQFQPFGQVHSQTLRPVTCGQLCKALGLNGNHCCVTLDGYSPCLESDLLIEYLLICAAQLTQLPPSLCPGALQGSSQAQSLYSRLPSPLRDFVKPQPKAQPKESPGAVLPGLAFWKLGYSEAAQLLPQVAGPLPSIPPTHSWSSWPIPPEQSDTHMAVSTCAYRERELKERD